MAEIDQRINQRAAQAAEQAAFQQIAMTQKDQAAAYQRQRQAWKTIRQGDKWVRVPMSSQDVDMNPKPRTVRQDGKWVVVCD